MKNLSSVSTEWQTEQTYVTWAFIIESEEDVCQRRLLDHGLLKALGRGFDPHMEQVLPH